MVLHRVLEGGAGEALGAGPADWLDANANLVRTLLAETDLLETRRQFALDEVQNLFRFRAARLIIDAGIDVLGVFPENHHVHLLRVFDGGRHALEVLHRPQAHVKVQQLAQGDIQRADPAAHGCGQGPFDTDYIFLERFDRVLGQPVIEFVLGGLAGIDFEPDDLALAAVGFLHCGLEDALAGRPDVRSGAVAANKRQDGMIRNVQFSVFEGDFSACGWG